MRIQQAGEKLAAGFNFVTTAATARAASSLNDFAGGPTPSAAPSPIRNLLLDEERYGLIDSVVAQIGLILQKNSESNGKGAAFYRLPTQKGPSALIQIPGGTPPDKVFEVNLVGPVLREYVTAVFVLTGAQQIDQTFRYYVQPRWKEQYFREVQSFDSGFFDFLKTQNSADQLDTVCRNFLLDREPPAIVKLEPSATNQIVEILRNQAVSPIVANSAQFLRNQVEALYVTNAAKGMIVGNLTGNVNDACRTLVEWAAGQSYSPDHEKRLYTVVGALLEALYPGSGVEERKQLADLVELYGLIRDRKVVARLRA